MTTIYHKPHSKRVREAAFVSWLQKHLPDARLIPENFPIEQWDLDRYVERNQLLEALKADRLLPTKPRQHSIEHLKHCPDLLKVALEPQQISFDVVVEKDGTPHYWEFHEAQHVRLTVARNREVYDAQTDVRVEIPRYLQRLIRDVWRMLYFRPYTIVWHDWFAENRDWQSPKLMEGLHEYHLPDRFSLKRFLSVN